MGLNNILLNRTLKLLILLVLSNFFRNIGQEVWIWYKIVIFEWDQERKTTAGGDESQIEEIPVRPKNLKQYSRILQEPIFLCGAQYGTRKNDAVKVLVLVLSTPEGKLRRQVHVDPR